MEIIRGYELAEDSEVPGEGPILMSFVRDGVVYAARKSSASSDIVLYQSIGGDWAHVKTLQNESF